MFKLFTFVLAATLSVSQATAQWVEPQHEGTVVSAAGNRLELTGRRGVRHVDRITPLTEVYIEGRPSRLSALRPGDRVRVFVDYYGVPMVVTSP